LPIIAVLQVSDQPHAEAGSLHPIPDFNHINGLGLTTASESSDGEGNQSDEYIILVAEGVRWSHAHQQAPSFESGFIHLAQATITRRRIE